MKDFLNKYYQNHALVYKISLFIVITVTIVYLFPKGGQFKYNIQKGKPWQYENLYAPFDFAILKTDEDVANEIEEKTIICKNGRPNRDRDQGRAESATAEEQIRERLRSINRSMGTSRAGFRPLGTSPALGPT